MSVEGLQFGWGRRLPVMLQSEAAECGLACLAMIASYHGQHSDPCDAAPPPRLLAQGRDAEGRDRGRRPRSASPSRPLRLELDELRMLRMPCILHWDLNHFVVLKAVGRSSVTIHDPAEGVRRLSHGRRLAPLHRRRAGADADRAASSRPRRRRGCASARCSAA